MIFQEKTVWHSLNELEEGPDILLKWFPNAILKTEPEKYHLFIGTSELTFKSKWNRITYNDIRKVTWS